MGEVRRSDPQRVHGDAGSRPGHLIDVTDAAMRRQAADPRENPLVEAHGVVVERWEQPELLQHLRTVLHDGAQPTAVASVNLDHLHHFGPERTFHPAAPEIDGLDWLMLADGAPIAACAAVASRQRWPRLTGADLLPDILRIAADEGARVGFLGGTTDVHHELSRTLAERLPSLEPPRCWAPPREVVSSVEGSRALADEIAAADVDVLCVGLGKPLQEMWIHEFGARSQAKVLLAFGAAADFIAGKTRRAPQWAQRLGLEWAYRLCQEPRRLARRYLVQGPRALLRLRRAGLADRRRLRGGGPHASVAGMPGRSPRRPRPGMPWSTGTTTGHPSP